MKKPLFLLIVVIVSGINAFAQKPIPSPTPAPFLMEVEDVFYISGRGTVTTGKIERGSVKVGDMIEIVGIGATKSATVSGIEMFRKMVDEAKAGDTVGILLRGVEKADVERGRVLVKPGSLASASKLKVKIDMVPVAEGGRKTPITSGFRPQVMIGLGSFSGTVTLAGGRTQAAAGDKAVEIDIELSQPAALEKGRAISLREYGKTVATGVITAVIPQK